MLTICLFPLFLCLFNIIYSSLPRYLPVCLRNFLPQPYIGHFFKKLYCKVKNRLWSEVTYSNGLVVISRPLRNHCEIHTETLNSDWRYPSFHTEYTAAHHWWVVCVYPTVSLQQSWNYNLTTNTSKRFLFVVLYHLRSRTPCVAQAGFNLLAILLPLGLYRHDPPHLV